MNAWISRCWSLFGRDEPASAVAEAAREPTTNTDRQPVPALLPWDRGHRPPGWEARALRAHLIDTLTVERDNAGTPSDRTFVVNLMRVVASPSLNLPPFAFSLRALRRLRSEGAQPYQLVPVIEGDPALVQRVWTSACRGQVGKPPRGLHHAISRIGWIELSRLVERACSEGVSFDVPGHQAAAEDVRERGRVVAELAAMISGEKRGPAYLAGLFHDVGKLIAFHSSNNTSQIDTVRRIAHENHAALGALAASIWGLGEGIPEAIASHHAPAGHGALTQCLRVADLVAHAASGDKETRETIQEAIAAIDPAIDFQLMTEAAEMLASGGSPFSDTAPTPTPVRRAATAQRASAIRVSRAVTANG